VRLLHLHQPSAVHLRPNPPNVRRQKRSVRQLKSSSSAPAPAVKPSRPYGEKSFASQTFITTQILAGSSGPSSSTSQPNSTHRPPRLSSQTSSAQANSSPHPRVLQTASPSSLSHAPPPRSLRAQTRTGMPSPPDLKIALLRSGPRRAHEETPPSPRRRRRQPPRAR